MIAKLYVCRKCNSQNIVKNGHNASGSQQYKCKDCDAHGVLEPSRGYTEEQREQIINDYYEFKYERRTTRFWCEPSNLIEMVKKKTKVIQRTETLLPAQPTDELELDEMWSFVFKKSKKRWLWTALCRRTRQIVAHVIGDRSVKTCRKLWALIPDEYKTCCSYSDFWDAYEKVFPKETHRSVGKESGETNHMERWNNTLRQSNARYVRKTLSFSKNDFYHVLVTRLYVIRCNLSLVH